MSIAPPKAQERRNPDPTSSREAAVAAGYGHSGYTKAEALAILRKYAREGMWDSAFSFAPEATAKGADPHVIHSILAGSSAAIEGVHGNPRKRRKNAYEPLDPELFPRLTSNPSEVRLPSRVGETITVRGVRVTKTKRDEYHALFPQADVGPRWGNGRAVRDAIERFGARANPATSAKITWKKPSASQKRWGISLVGRAGGNSYEIERRGTTYTGTTYTAYVIPSAGSFGGGVREAIGTRSTLVATKRMAEAYA